MPQPKEVDVIFLIVQLKKLRAVASRSLYKSTQQISTDRLPTRTAAGLKAHASSRVVFFSVSPYTERRDGVHFRINTEHSSEPSRTLAVTKYELIGLFPIHLKCYDHGKESWLYLPSYSYSSPVININTNLTLFEGITFLTCLSCQTIRLLRTEKGSIFIYH